jgi:zinc/manganese transport system substrate-binding protein
MRMILNFRSKLGMTVVLLVALSLAVPACGDGSASDDRIEIVATTSILGDIVSQIVGDDATVDVVIGPGIDPHDFQASARQVESIARADLVIAIGLGLEESLIDVIDTQAAEALFLGPELDPLPFLGHDGAGADEAEQSDALDPHVWLDPVRMAEAVPLIVERLQRLYPALDLQSRADAYVDRLEALDAEIAQTLAPIPEGSRKLVTSHDALGYFAARYDFEVIGVIVAGGSTLAEPSAADLAALAEAIRSSGARAIFTDAYNPTTLAEAVASEVDAEVAVVPLITGSLTEDASTYTEMMTINAERIAGALGAAG